MDIATSFSALNESDQAIEDAIYKLNNKIAAPSLLLLYFSESYDENVLQSKLVDCYPNTPILACSSCQGIMTDEGYVNGKGLGLWAINDFNGAYGTSIVSTNDSSFEMGKQAILKAIHNSGRLGELPSLILLHATPGNEEAVIQGIEAELGKNVPIIGGSAADDNIVGNWKLFNQDQQTSQGVGITVFYPTCDVSLSFHSGYISTGNSAIATKVEGREIIELDNQPAADVYQKWIQQPLESNTNFVNQSSLNPLGRIVGEIYNLPYYKLAHPLCITERNGIKMFAGIEQGEQLFFMTGTEERLVTRAGRVVNSTTGPNFNPIGGITIYCAGCMLKVQNRMDEVAQHINIAMHKKPFISPFTFGEQGQFIGGENAHGNLMISAVIFHGDINQLC